MSGHTPGPWRSSEDAPVTRKVRGRSGPQYFAKTVSSSGTIQAAKAFGPTAAEAAANAHLIAAAPELLEALEEIMAQFADELRPGNFDRARTAIAKARGES